MQHQDSSVPRKYKDSTFWDEWYGRQEHPLEWSTGASPALLARIQAVLHSLPQRTPARSLRLCEVGCGTSSLVVSLAEEGVEVCGVDFSEEVINQMQRRHPEVEWQRADALRLSEHFPPASFDCIVGKTLLDCLLTRDDSRDAVQQFLQQARRLLVDDGRLVLLDRNEAGWLMQRGHHETFIDPACQRDSRPMVLRILTPLVGDYAEQAPAGKARIQILLEWPQGQAAGLTLRRVDLGAALSVVGVESYAANACVMVGDRILAVDNVAVLSEIGRAQARLQELNGGRLDLLIERRPEAGGRAMRRTSSQDAYLLRVERARDIQKKSLGRRYGRSSSRKAIVDAGPAVPAGISVPRDIAAGLFMR